jgi:hypothetical protein
MSTNPYAPPQEQSEADPVEELCVRAPDLRDEIQAVAATGNQGPFAKPTPTRKLVTAILWAVLTIVAFAIWDRVKR